MIKRIEWKRVWARKYAPYIASTFMRVFMTKPGFDMCKNKLFLPEGGINAIYFAEDEFSQLIKNATELLMKDDMRQFAEEYENTFRKFLSWAENFSKTDFSSLSDKEIIAKLEECSRNITESAEDQFFSFVVLEGPGRELEKMLSLYSNKEKIKQWIATPYKETKLTKIRLELLKMMKERKTSEKELKDYAERNRWITVYEFVDKPFTIDDAREIMAHIKDPEKEIENIKAINKDNLNNYNEFIKSIDDEKLKKTAKIMHYFTYLKEMRDDYRRHAYYLLAPFINELAKRAGMTLIEVNQLIHKEIVDAIKTHDPGYKKKAQARQKKYSLLFKDGELSIFDYDISPDYIKEQESGKESEIKGVVANKGKVTGKVNIIFHRNDFSKFRQGDVLVTPMTHPEFMPVIKKAIAIITDEGGITCHAAITAREFGVPCIIGTKIATKALKDGDRVEVDADSGIVRKL
ncbi:MAG: hypothetical protein KKE20_06475 [Nanoarchaeota archaeon]|nr:hypothetical protein [Nanoarchaeota archaeon]